jgi:hypothetical protein
LRAVIIAELAEDIRDFVLAFGGADSDEGLEEHGASIVDAGGDAKSAPCGQTSTRTYVSYNGRHQPPRARSTKRSAAWLGWAAFNSLNY